MQRKRTEEHVCEPHDNHHDKKRKSSFEALSHSEIDHIYLGGGRKNAELMLLSSRLFGQHAPVKES